MRKAAILIVVPLLLAFALTGCSDPTYEQKKELDDAIHVVEAALGRYFTVDPAGPVDQVTSVTARVESSWEGVRETAEGLDEFDLTDAEAALAGLLEATAALPDELTAREGIELLEPYIDAFEAEVDEIHDALDMH